VGEVQGGDEGDERAGGIGGGGGGGSCSPRWPSSEVKASTPARSEGTKACSGGGAAGGKGGSSGGDRAVKTFVELGCAVYTVHVQLWKLPAATAVRPTLLRAFATSDIEELQAVTSLDNALVSFLNADATPLRVADETPIGELRSAKALRVVMSRQP